MKADQTLDSISVTLRFIKEKVDKIDAIHDQTLKTNGRVNGLEQREEITMEHMKELGSILASLQTTSDSHTGGLRLLKWGIPLLVTLTVALSSVFFQLAEAKTRAELDVRINSLCK